MCFNSPPWPRRGVSRAQSFFELCASLWLKSVSTLQTISFELLGEGRMRGWLMGLSTVLVVCVLATDVAWGQATAQISGTVRDPSGAVLPGVEITATQTETGIARTTVTNETGSYALPNLPTGPYRIEAGLPGFLTFVQSGIAVQGNSHSVINPVLQIGQVT